MSLTLKIWGIVRIKIEPFLFEGKQLQVNECIIDKLLNVISDVFIIADIEQKVKEDEEFIEVTEMKK